MSAADHKRWSEELAAYMLGALDPGEAKDFERHLDGCEHCQEELRWLQPAVHALPEEVERTEPPPQLRESLMAEVRADARAQTAAARPAPARSKARRWFLRPAMGFAVLALLVAGVVGYEVGKDGSDEGGAPSRIVRQFDEVTVTMVSEGEGGSLQLEGVRQPPPGKVLETWVLREGEVESIPPLFVPDRHGRAEAAIHDMSGVEEVMVTEEPQGGSEEPSGEQVFSMAVPQ